MDLKSLNADELINTVKKSEDMQTVRDVADFIGVTYSGNSGMDSLKVKVVHAIEDAATTPESEEVPAITEFEPIPEPVVAEASKDEAVEDLLGANEPLPELIPVAKAPKKPSINDLLMMDANKETDPILIRQIVRAKGLRLSRVVITNLDPADSSLSGGIITVRNKFLGKVSKYIPYGDESGNGYHIPEVLLNHLRSQQFALRKEIKGKLGVRQYKTTMTSKFNIQILPPLTKSELDALAITQGATHSISE